MHRFSPLLRLPAAVLLIALAVPAIARADSRTESQFISATNSSRASHGLRNYMVADDLTAVARRWAAHMAAHRTLEHNPSYTSEICCWTRAGENVGVGASVAQVERAFMASAPHRAHILSSSYTQVGIGTARSSDGRLWVDELFRRSASSAPRVTRTTSGSTTRASRPSTDARRVTTSTHAASDSGARPASARASRSLARTPGPQTAAAALAWSVRLSWARAAAPPAATTDPVSEALAYLHVMQRLDGSTTG